MKESVAFLIVALIAGIGYIGYRYSSIPDAQEVIYGERWNRISRYSPAICNLVGGGFEEATNKRVYIYKGQSREEFEATRGNQKVQGVVLVTKDDTAYIWYAGETEGGIIRNYSRKPTSDVTPYIARSATCSPWWLPDESLFEPPALVNFAEVTTPW